MEEVTVEGHLEAEGDKFKNILQPRRQRLLHQIILHNASTTRRSPASSSHSTRLKPAKATPVRKELSNAIRERIEALQRHMDLMAASLVKYRAR